MCGCQGPVVPTDSVPLSLLSSSGNFDPASVILVTDPDSKASMIVMEYVGPNQSTFSVLSRVTRNVTYRFGNNDHHRTRAVLLGDAQYLLGLNTLGSPDYRVVSNVAVPDVNDPVSFLGAPITA